MLRDGEAVYSVEGGMAITYIKAKDSLDTIKPRMSPG